MKNGWKNSIQKKIFLLVMPTSTLTFILLGLIWIFSSKSYTEKNIISTDRQILSTMIQATDIVLANVDENITAITQDADMINLAAVPNLQEYSRNRRVMLKLNSMQEQGYVKSVSIYLPWLDTVFDGGTQVYRFQESSLYPAISAYQESYDSLSGYGDGAHDRSRLMLDKYGRLFVLRSFPKGGRTMMYIVAAQLDTEQLTKKLSESLQQEKNVMVLSNDGKIIMSSDEQRVGTYFDYEGYEESDEDNTAIERRSRALICWDTSEYSGMTFIIQTEDAFTGWAKRTVRSSIITVAILLVLQFAIAGVAAARIFRPIESFVNHVLTPNTRWTDSDTQIGYLSKAYEEVAERRASTGQAIAMLQRAVIKKSIRAYFEGDEIPVLEQREIEELLTITDKKGRIFFLMLIHTVKESTLPFNEAEKDAAFLKASLQGILENELEGTGGEIQVITANSRNQVCLVSYDVAENYEQEITERLRGAIEKIKSITDDGVVVLVSGKPVPFQELGAEVCWLKIKMVQYESERLDGLGISIVILDKYRQVFNAGMQKLLMDREPDELLGTLSSLTEKGDAECRAAIRIYIDSFSAAVSADTMIPSSIADFADDEKKKTMQLFDSGADSNALICRALLTANTVSRLLRENYVRNNVGNMRKIIEYIGRHYQQPDMGLANVADSMGVTSSYLSRQFKEFMGVNYVSYVNSLRIEKAQYYLIDGQLPVNKVAESVGFSSVQHFNRVFKQLTNYTPGAFRSMFRGTT